MTRGLIVAAASSGSGKTTVTLALLRALRRAGIRAAGLKIGPDFIDPAFQAAASGRPCGNLDGWAMRPAILRRQIDTAAGDADLIVVEGVMGLYDGASAPGPYGDGSTAAIARATGWPVLLVLDVGGQAATAAAVALGLARFDPDIAIAGVICNRVGSAAHARLLADGFGRTDLPLLACLPRRADLGLPSRHLGLVQAGEHADLDALLDRAADWLTGEMPVDRLAALAGPLRAAATDAVSALPPPGQHIAVARDDAFAFAYPHLLAGWRAMGAAITFFSPLADQAPEDRADAVYLPGGYPELHAGRLAGARRFADGMRAAAARGAFVYGECGGYMALGRGLIDAQGHRHEMTGLLPVEFSFAAPKRKLGYRRVRLLTDQPFGAAGQAFSAHEFHYATVLAEPLDTALFAVADAGGRALGTAGCRSGRIAGSFIHLIDLA